MGWFRRSRGRHALGAPKRVAAPAVVAAPFVPVPVAADLSFFPAGSVGVGAEPTPTASLRAEHLSEHAVVREDLGPLRTHLAEPAPAVEADDLMGSIAALIVSGEAWVDSPVLPVQRPAVPVPAAQAMTFAPAPVARLPVQPVTVEVLSAGHPPVERLPVEHLAVGHRPVEPEPLAPISRIQLGFRDGTTASLDPDSEQAAALEELALLLSLRD